MRSLEDDIFGFEVASFLGESLQSVNACGECFYFLARRGPSVGTLLRVVSEKFFANQFGEVRRLDEHSRGWFGLQILFDKDDPPEDPEVLDHFEAWYLALKPLPHASHTSSSSDKFVKAKIDSPSERASEEDLSVIASLQSRYLFSALSQKTGLPFSDSLEYIRSAGTLELLATGNRDLEEVVRAVGFENLTDLEKAIERWTIRSPVLVEILRK